MESRVESEREHVYVYESRPHITGGKPNTASLLDDNR